MYNVLEYSCEKGVHWQVEGFWGRGMFFYMSVEEMGLSVSGEGISPLMGRMKREFLL